MGAVVEVKNQDGIYQEATINKLTDASLYTVGKCGGEQDKWCHNNESGFSELSDRNGIRRL